MKKGAQKMSLILRVVTFKRVQLLRVYCLLTGQTYTEDYITFADAI